MNHPDEKIDISAGGTTASAVIETFLQSSDHEVECSEIVGRTFADTADHARTLRLMIVHISVGASGTGERGGSQGRRI